MCAAERTKKRQKIKYINLSGFSNEQKSVLLLFYFLPLRAVSYNRKCLFISDLHVFSS